MVTASDPLNFSSVHDSGSQDATAAADPGTHIPKKRLEIYLKLLDPTSHPEKYSAPESTNYREKFRVITPRKKARLTLVEVIEKRLRPSEAFNGSWQSQNMTRL